MTPTRRYKQGDKVMVNGYPGVIVREYSTRMYEVRLASGVCCVDMTDQEGKPENAALDTGKEQP